MLPETAEIVKKAEGVIADSRRVALLVMRETLAAQKTTIELLSVLAETDEERACCRDMRYSHKQLEGYVEEAEAIYYRG